MPILYFYFASEPTEDVEIKGTPLTYYPQSRANTYPCDVYDGFLLDYQKNIASLIYHADELSVYRSGLIGDLATDTAILRSQELEIKEEEFTVTVATQTDFIVTKFNINQDISVYSGSDKLLSTDYTLTISTNTVSLTVQAEQGTVITIKK